MRRVLLAGVAAAALAVVVAVGVGHAGGARAATRPAQARLAPPRAVVPLGGGSTCFVGVNCSLTPCRRTRQMCDGVMHLPAVVLIRQRRTAAAAGAQTGLAHTLPRLQRTLTLRLRR
ncbi:MAG: hypothetical protein WBQ18_03900 [Solirubrobacteraceae bacterium]